MLKFHDDVSVGPATAQAADSATGGSLWRHNGRGKEVHDTMSSTAERSTLVLMTPDGVMASAVSEALNSSGRTVTTTVVRDMRGLMAHISGDGQVLAIVDLDPNPRVVLAELERLTARFPALRVVALASVLESDLLLEAMQAGVRRVVAKESISAELRGVLSRFSPGDLNSSAGSGQVITILSSSGGCGATTIAANLAAELGAKTADHPALVIDLDCAYGSLATFFGLSPRYAVDHVLHYEGVADTDLLRSTTTVHSSEVHLLASPASTRLARSTVLNYDRLSDVITLANRAYSHTIVDAPRIPPDVAATLVAASTHVLLMFQLTVKDLRMARAMIDALDDFGVHRHHLVPVANRYVKRPPISLEDASKVLGGLEIRTLRNDFPAALEGINYGRMLAQAAPRSPLRRDLQALVTGLVPA
jgi:pilus assembly protein CpaE